MSDLLAKVIRQLEAHAMTAQDLAREWLAADPDERMRALLAATLAEAEAGSVEAQAELEDAFAGTLEFGTAGLRAASVRARTA